jgi:large subunit ribosomal protein L15
LGLAPHLRILSRQLEFTPAILKSPGHINCLCYSTTPYAMASLLPVRALRTASCSACRSLISSGPAQLALPLSRRNYSTPAEQEPVDYTNKPRWSYTPPRAKAPFSLHFDSKRPDFPVNSDPQVLDQFYIRFLGEGGDKVLSDEVKWLAVTHKSFDQGRRGFNDRLAFLGMLSLMSFRDSGPAKVHRLTLTRGQGNVSFSCRLLLL